MHKHRFKFLRQSKIHFEGKEITIDVFQCIDCERMGYINVETGEQITLNGLMGEETCL